MTNSRRSLDAELDRVWLWAELSLRRLQRAGLRAAADHAAVAELEAVLAARRLERGGGSGPDGEETLSRLLADREADVRSRRKDTRWGRTTVALGLDALAIDVAVLAAAPQIDPPLSELFDVVRGRRGGVDLALASTLLRLPRAARARLAEAILPDAPLVRFGLIAPTAADGGGAVRRSLHASADLLACLREDVELPPSLRGCAHSIEPSLMTSLPAALAGRLDRFAAALAEQVEHRPWIAAIGPAGAGKRRLAAHLAARMRRPLIAVDVRAAADDREWVRGALREAAARGAVLYIGPLDGVEELAGALDAHRGPMVLGFEKRAGVALRTRHAVNEVHLPPLSEPRRHALWERSTPAACRDVNVDLRSLARAFELTAGEIATASAEATAIADAESRRVRQDDLRRAVDRRLQHGLGSLARRIDVSARWDDLVLPDEEMARVHEFIARGQHARRVYEEWGFGQRIGYGKGLVALFSGPPGTGKTMLAGLIGAALGLDVYQADLASVFSKWVGETEKNLSSLFDEAERARAVLLFDEADALFAKRTDVEGANDRYGNLAVNYLLQRLEQYRGVGILTTNREAALDPALQRRLSLHLRLQIPAVDERERLWHSLMPGDVALRESIDFAYLARRFELAGGHIRNAVLRAAFLAAAADTYIGNELLERAAVLELEDMGRLVAAPTTDVSME